MSQSQLPRDVFIDTIFAEAKKNRNIVFITADLGAKALDRFRAELPGQFIHAGICEQNMIDVAAGLAQNDKIVFVYAMAPFVTLRCYEQIKVAVASMHLPLCIIGNGVGYSYDDAGPTHYATEDVSCMRALGGCEVLTVADTRSALATAELCCAKPALRYVRLDRAFLPDVYSADDTRFLKDGIVDVAPGRDALLLANGYMMQRALEVKKLFAEDSINLGVADVYRLRPIDGEVLKKLTQNYPRLITLEEHFISGGTGGAIAEAMADAQILKPLLRLAIPDSYHFDNGGRKHILACAGLDVPTIRKRIAAFLKS